MSLTAIGFLALYGGGLLLSLARHPIWGLMTYVITFYLHPPVRWWGEALPDIRWSFIAAIITLLATTLNASKLQSNGSFFSLGIVRALIFYTIWLAIQLTWAMDINQHLEFTILFVKYLILIYLIFRIIDNEDSLRLFLWSHVVGCFTMGWIAYTTYTGGRFEGFGPPNVSEANAGGLQLVTGLYTLAALFLAGGLRQKLPLLGMSAFITNGIITTISRSAFLESGIGAFFFNLFTPKSKRRLVLLLSVAGIFGFLALTSQTYWSRITTIEEAGQQVEGKNTGYARVVLMQAQWKMFEDNIMGCGHRCTAILSPLYLPDSYLTGPAGHRGRASHNTLMSLLVEQGIVGVLFYLYIAFWVFKNLFKLRRDMKDSSGLIPLALTACASALSAIFVGDMFVDYLKLESRLWFIAVLMVLPALHIRTQENPY